MQTAEAGTCVAEHGVGAQSSVEVQGVRISKYLKQGRQPPGRQPAWGSGRLMEQGMGNGELSSAAPPPRARPPPQFLPAPPPHLPSLPSPPPHLVPPPGPPP